MIVLLPDAEAAECICGYYCKSWGLQAAWVAFLTEAALSQGVERLCWQRPLPMSARPTSSVSRDLSCSPCGLVSGSLFIICQDKHLLMYMSLLLPALAVNHSCHVACAHGETPADNASMLLTAHHSYAACR